MKIETEKKIRSHGYYVNKTRPWHGHKKCTSKTVFTCMKQHLSSIWSSIYKKVKQQWG